MIYKDIVGYEGKYKVSDDGNVLSVRTGKLLSKIKMKSGYYYVHLCDGVHHTKLCKLHRVVAQAFIPNPNKLPQVNHKNGDKSDNSVDNLEWCDAFHNMQHAINTGLFNVVGEHNPSAKLNYNDVKHIREIYVKGSRKFGTNALAKEYNVSNVLIGKIVRYEIWKDRKKGDI